MGLPTITTIWNSIPPEYKIPIPEIYKTIIRDINNLPVIDDMASWPGFYNNYNVRDVEISIESDEMVFTDEGSTVPESWLENEMRVCDPYAVFIAPEYTLNYSFPSLTVFKPSIIGYGKFPFTNLIELHTINFPKWFYASFSDDMINYPGVIAIDKDTREFLNTPDAHINKLFYPTSLLRIKGQYKEIPSGSWTSFNVIRRVNLLNYLFGFIGRIQKNSPEAVASIKDFESSKISDLNTCLMTPTFAGSTDFGIPSPVINTVYCMKEAATTRNEWDTYPCSLAANVSRKPYAAFNNLIFVKDANDFDSLFDMPYDDFLDRIVDGEEEAEKEPGEYDPGGISKPDGGGGSYGRDEESDDISVDIPFGSVEADSSGTFTRYLVNSSQLGLFGEWLWTTDLGLAIAKTAISLIYGDPSESLIGLISFPFNLEAMQGMSTNRTNLFWGNFDSGLAATAVRNAAVRVDWGSIQLNEYWGNFLDYSPHTKIDLYLPWGTGFVSIDPGQCLPGSIQVITNIELSKGSCIHNVIGNNGCVIGSYSGQCGKQVPLISSDFASKMAGTVTAAAAGLAAGAIGAAGLASGAAYGAKLGDSFQPTGFGNFQFMTKSENMFFSATEQAGKNFLAASKPAAKIATSSLAVNKIPTHVTRNGGFTDGSASLGIQYPYIILSRPSQSMPEQYGSYFGYPSNIYTNFRSLKGYTEVSQVHIENISATENEISEIDALLKGGVIF